VRDGVEPSNKSDSVLGCGVRVREDQNLALCVSNLPEQH